MIKEKYITEFTNTSGKKYSWHIFATSQEEALELITERGIGEKILGVIPHDCADCELEITE